MIIVFISLALLFLLNIFLISMLFIASKKLLKLDDLFDLLQQDIQVNLQYLENLIKTPLFMDSPEVREVHKNMRFIWMRMVEFSTRIQEQTGRMSLSAKEETEGNDA